MNKIYDKLLLAIAVLLLAVEFSLPAEVGCHYLSKHLR